jgi:hypothetical protein
MTIVDWFLPPQKIYILSYDEKIGHIVIGQQICSQHNGSYLKQLFFILIFKTAYMKNFPEYVYSQRYSSAIKFLMWTIEKEHKHFPKPWSSVKDLSVNIEV